MLRYSLCSLLIAVLIVALFCASLANATVPWREGAQWATWFFLLTAVVAAIASREQKRAIAAGMAVFGLGFFYLLEIGRIRPALAETSVAWAFVAVHGSPPLPVDENGEHPSRTIQEFMRLPGQPGPDSDLLRGEALYDKRKTCFAEIAYEGLAVLLSLLGGGLGMIFYTRSGHSGVNKMSA